MTNKTNNTTQKTDKISRPYHKVYVRGFVIVVYRPVRSFCPAIDDAL